MAPNLDSFFGSCDRDNGKNNILSDIVDFINYICRERTYFIIGTIFSRFKKH